MLWSWAEAPEARRRTIASARETRSPRRSEPPHFPVLDFTSLGPRIFVFKLSILPVLVSHGGSSWSCSVSALRVATVTSSHCGTERRFCSGSMRPAKALSWLFWSEAAQEKKRIFIFQAPALRIWQSREKVDALLSAELLSAGAGTQGPPNQSTPSGPTRSSPTSRLFPGDGIVLATPRTCQRKLCGLKGGGQHPTATRGWQRGRRGEVVKVVRGICWGRVTDWVDEELQTRA